LNMGLTWAQHGPNMGPTVGKCNVVFFVGCLKI
jgi:hypothetical protein